MVSDSALRASASSPCMDGRRTSGSTRRWPTFRRPRGTQPGRTFLPGVATPRRIGERQEVGVKRHERETEDINRGSHPQDRPERSTSSK